MGSMGFWRRKGGMAGLFVGTDEGFCILWFGFEVECEV